MAVSYKKQTHRSKGKAGKIPHPSGMSPHSGARKNRLTKVLREREEGVAQRKMNKNKTVPKPKRKPPVPKNQDIDMGYTTIALNSGGSVEDALKGKNKIPTIKPKSGPFKVRPPGYKPPVVKKPTNSKSEFEGYMEKTQPKKYGGKINYRMGGGQVVDSSYDN